MTSFLQTKLYCPERHHDAIVRPRLLAQLNDGLRADRMLAVLAPAGFGKTTLVSCWLRDLLDSHAPYRPAWYSIDGRDNDPYLFMRYLVAAIRSASPGSLAGVHTMLGEGLDWTTSQLVTALLRDAAELPDEVLLVLDDYHVITHPDIHEIVHTLIHYRPPLLHLIITARHDPPIGIARLRVHDQLTEIRADDLAFTPAETDEFLRTALGQAVESDTTDALQEGTEGWAAGLRLATIAMRESGDPAGLVRGFRQHSHRFVTDYLVSEVLDGRSEPEQQFLLMTSILRRLNRELCAAVVGTLDPLDSQTMLEELERSGLFLSALDDWREWFRYHPQFRIILNGLLARRLGAEQHEGLHRRAAAWYARSGFPEDAVEHYLAVGDVAAAADHVSHQLADLYNQGGWNTVRHLLAQLPPETVTATPVLLLARIWLAVIELDSPTAEMLAQQLEGLLPPTEPGNEHLLGMRSQLDAIRGSFLIAPTPPADRRALLRRSLAGLARSSTFMRGFVWHNLVRATGSPAELPRLARLLGDEMTASADQVSYRLQLQYIVTLLYLRLGTLDEAEVQARRLLLMAEDAGELSSIVQGHAGLAFIAFCRNELPQAMVHLEPLAKDPLVAGAELVLDLAFPAVITYSSLGRPDRSADFINAAGGFANRGPVRHEAAALQALERLLVGDLAGAVALADADESPPPDFYWERRAIVMALVRMVQGDPDHIAAAAARLDDYLTILDQAEDGLVRILALVTRARLHWWLGEREPALDAYERALALGFARGFRRWYMGGRDVVEILTALAATGRRVDEARQLLQVLLGEVRIVTPVPGERAAAAAPSIASHEELSEREAQVLSLLASKMSNKEIAAALGISPITVRNHTVNLYGKLQVGTRSEAVERARNLGLLVN